MNVRRDRSLLSVLMTILFAACCCQAVSGRAAGQGSDEWITVNKDYSSQRYVDLDQINPGTVDGLKEVCEAQLNEPSWFSSGLLMVDRTLYATTLRATYAIDAATCAVRWRSVLQLGKLANISNRGPGYLDGSIFRGTADGRVIALDAKTGEVLWDQKEADPDQNESFVAAPIAWNGKVFIGIAISDLGIRGRLVALDAKTGKELWRFNTVPEPDAKSWGGGKPAGGGFWTTFSLDPAKGEILAPVANPAPDFEPQIRPGDNFYTNSVIDLDAATGHLNWYFQQEPRDDHDWDLGSAPTLYRTRRGKEMVVVAGKNGYVDGLDRQTRALMFKTPGTTIANNGPLPKALTLVCPGLGGGSQYNGAAYDPQTGALYVGEVDWCAYYQESKRKRPDEEETMDLSTSPQSALNYSHDEAVFADYTHQPKGWITAIDGETGRILWKYQTDAQMLAGLVPTKGGLVFAGDVRGNLFAFDAKTGTVRKHFNLGGALNNGLISYAIEGTQYVAATVGGATLNTRGVSGPLTVEIFGLRGGDTPTIVRFDRLETQSTGAAADAEIFARVCAPCHGANGKGRGFPSVTRFTELGDPATLKTFLANVPPPMPVLYPALLTDQEVGMIAAYLKSSVLEKDGPSSGYVQPKSDGSPQWQTIYSVMTSPRCINCHSAGDYPRQTDDHYPHIYHVMRGPGDKGTEILRCTACHGIRNDAATGIPGRIDWHEAPAGMSTESSPGVPKTGAQVCRDLKDKSKNGNRDFAQLLHFIHTDAFIPWAWDPGTRPNGKPRTTPPLVTHQQFVDVFKAWIDSGAPCPN
jgi:alcohol dehydrogenase (cytochrome c)